MTVLANAGATVAATDHDRVTVAGLTAEHVIKLLNQHGLPFSEVAAHRASLEEAYMELTRDAVEFAAVAGGVMMKGFLRVLHGEWTKFRSVRSTALCLLAAVGVSVLLEVLGSSAGKTDANEQPRFSDQAYFVHKPLAGDGTIVARVVSQQNSHEWAKAGLLVKAAVTPGAPYAAVMVTPEHGMRMQAMFDTELAGPPGRCAAVAQADPDGQFDHRLRVGRRRRLAAVGTVTVALPRDVEVGLFVASPPLYVSKRTGSGTSIEHQEHRGYGDLRRRHRDRLAAGTRTGPVENISTLPSKQTGGVPHRRC